MKAKCPPNSTEPFLESGFIHSPVPKLQLQQCVNVDLACLPAKLMSVLSTCVLLLYIVYRCLAAAGLLPMLLMPEAPLGNFQTFPQLSACAGSSCIG